MNLEMLKEMMDIRDLFKKYAPICPCCGQVTERR